jgi:3-oxoacyl-[acyl-carrier protein] reductase
MDLGLAGKACAVTGASRGIGRETARLLCAEGARVLLVARGERDLAEAVDLCRSAGADAGGEAESLALDVTEEDAGESIVASCEERFAQLDVLVNNAGTARWRPLEDVPDADWQAAWELNVIAPLRAMRAAIPGMRERGWGRIVNVASTAGKRPSALMPEYSVAKAAELSLSRLFADQHAKDGVLVNAICPGPTKSEMWMGEGGLLDQSREAGGMDSRKQALDAAGAKRPIGRLAEVSEIAGAIVFLCSDQASYVAGAAWSVDGGTVQVII